MTAVLPRKFTCDSPIAKTQLAWVYRGTYEGNRQVAIKRVLQDSENLVLTELSTLLKVDNHENVVRYYYSETDDIFCYIVMELCDKDLQKYIEEKQTQDLEKILYGAAKGLEHIHDRSIIHGDLKPSNILVTKRGSELIAKICDFGISKELPQGQTSRTGTNQGTEQYKAPEFFLSGGDSNERDGNPKPRFSLCTDMYSFGLVVFFVFSKGKHLCGDYPENLANIKTGTLVNLVEISDVPSAKSLVLWATARSPKDRPTMAEVLHHPLFWDKLKTIDFIKDVSGAFEDRNDEFLKDLKGRIDEDAHYIICSSPATCTKAPSELNPIACADWTKSLSSKSEVFKDIDSRTKHPRSFCDLVRIIRNKDLHWSQLSNNVRSEYGGTKIAFHDYWMSRFPSLAVYLWDKLELTYLTAILTPYYCVSSVRRGRFEQAFLTGVKDGDYTETEKRVRNGVNVNCNTSEMKKTALCLAEEYGHKEILNLLKKRSASPCHKDENQRTRIHLAALNGHVDSMKIVSGTGAECNSLDLNNCTPLHLASENGNKEVVKLLPQYRVEVNSEYNVGRTPLHLASQFGHEEVVKIRLDRGEDINCKDKDNYTPLHLASENGHTGVVKLLLDRGAYINCKSTENQTPLMQASYKGHAEVIKLLLDRGADINLTRKGNSTTLHVASENGRAEVVKLLLDRGADINCKNKDNWTPLLFASQNGHTEVVKLLLDRGADINCKQKDNSTPLHIASQKGQTGVVKLLLDRGADINCKNKDNWIPVLLASQNGHTEVVKLLLDHGADINFTGKRNLTPLHVASENGRAEVVKLLLDRSADINCKTMENFTPLFLASYYSHVEVVKQLLERGADINCKNKDNWTPLHVATQNGHTDVVALLLDRGADINCTENHNWTPLHLASQNRDAEIVALLLDRGADLNCKDTENRTPQHIASMMGHAEVVKLLLDLGEDRC